MTPKTKLTILLFGLILPYMALAIYMGFRLRGNIVPLWFRYVAPCYLVVAVSVFIVGRKKILASSVPPRLREQSNRDMGR
jgi:hypothetical protein